MASFSHRVTRLLDAHISMNGRRNKISSKFSDRSTAQTLRGKAAKAGGWVPSDGLGTALVRCPW